MVAMGADGRGRVVHVHDVAVAIRVHRVENWQLLHAHGVSPFVDVAGQTHPPELLEHPWTIRRQRLAAPPSRHADRRTPARAPCVES